MKKLGLILGVAAVAAVSGCLDPSYSRGQKDVDEVKPAQPAPAAPVETVKPVEVQPVEVKPIAVEKQRCTCAPGTKHAEPCACGADDCKCVVEVPAAKPVAEPEPETTTYIVQRGDYLAKISKKYNVTIASIRRLNPQIKNDVIRIGQKIKLPGKIDVGEQKVPEVAKAAPAAKPAREYKPYTGETKEYVVKSGDTLGAIAYGNGITIRQLKELNGLSSNTIRVGQKLKLPAAKVVADKPAPAVKPVAAPKPEEPAAESATPANQPAGPVESVAVPAVGTVTAAVEGAVDTVKSATQDGVTYVVKEGEDLIDLSARFSLSPSEIRALNNLGEDDKLVPGQVLKLPAETQL